MTKFERLIQIFRLHSYFLTYHCVNVSYHEGTVLVIDPHVKKAAFPVLVMVTCTAFLQTTLLMYYSPKHATVSERIAGKFFFVICVMSI